MGLIHETTEVFAFLRSVFELLPVAIRLLVYGAFGGVVFIAVVRGIGR